MVETSSFHESPKDAFTGRLSQRAPGNSRPASEHQSRGCALSADEHHPADPDWHRASLGRRPGRGTPPSPHSKGAFLITRLYSPATRSIT